MTYDFAIYVDFGKNIGFGHFFRCYSLLQELSLRGKTVILLLKNDNFDFVKNFDYLVINSKNPISAIKNLSHQFKNLIIDLYDEIENYDKELSQICPTIILDDLGNKKLTSHILINGSIVNEYHKYSLNAEFTTLLVGPKFMIIRSEFIDERKKVSISQKQIEKILISFGGSDGHGLTEKILLLLVENNFHLTVVIGPGNSSEQLLFELSQKYPNVIIKKNVIDMASLFAKQDLVISSAGVSSYELASLGIPTIFVPAVPHQFPTAYYMEQNGFGKIFEILKDKPIQLLTLINELNDYDLRKKMFDSGRKIVDGKGVIRVVDSLMKL